MKNDWTTVLFIRHLTKSLRENEKIKAWPVYREHAGM